MGEGCSSDCSSSVEPWVTQNASTNSMLLCIDYILYDTHKRKATPKMKNRMTQASRLAASTYLGPEVFAFLQRPEIIAKLKEAAAAGTQPVSAISLDLLASFPSVIRDAAMKRRVGFFIAAILDAEGFDVLEPNVRTKNPVFASGAIYQKRSEPTTTLTNLISRLSDAFTEDEARQFVEFLIARFPGLKKHGR